MNPFQYQYQYLLPYTSPNLRYSINMSCLFAFRKVRSIVQSIKPNPYKTKDPLMTN